MENRVPFSTFYFCANCEEEVVGMPAGSRIASGRPLCLRCTEIGEQEGWGTPNSNKGDQKINEETKKGGFLLIVFMMAVVAIMLFAINIIWNGKSQR